MFCRLIKNCTVANNSAKVQVRFVRQSTRKGILRYKSLKNCEYNKSITLSCPNCKHKWVPGDLPSTNTCSTVDKPQSKELATDWITRWLPSKTLDQQSQFILSLLSNVKLGNMSERLYLLDLFTKTSNKERLEREKRKAAYEEAIEQLLQYDAYCTDVNEDLEKTTAIAFSGGGVLGNAYVGALSILEKHGLNYKKITKLAGTSAGALTAATLAVGHDAESCNRILKKTGFKDLFSLEYSTVFSMSGISSGRKLEEYIGKVLEEKTGNPDITLKEIYDNYGKELICVATELDTLRERKFCYRTDPDLPVRHAVRMSSSIPILLEPVEYNGHLYVDGGLTNNFPVDELPEEGGIGIVADTWEVLAQMRYFIHLDSADSFEKELVTAMKERWEHVSRQKRRIVSIFDVAFASIRCLVQNNFSLRLRIADVEVVNHEHMQPPRNWWLCVGEIDSFRFDLDEDKQQELYNNGRISALFLIQSWMRRKKRKQLNLPNDEILEGPWKAPVGLLWKALTLLSLTGERPSASTSKEVSNEENKEAPDTNVATVPMQEEFMQQALHDMTSEEEKINKEKEALEEEEKSSLQEQLSIYETIIQEIRARLSQLTLTRTHSSNANKENEEGEKAELEGSQGVQRSRDENSSQANMFQR
eukprot:jgi/Galph1/3923/GphlegSOOS_G2632.1